MCVAGNVPAEKARRSASATRACGEKSIVFNGDDEVVVEDELLTIRPRVVDNYDKFGDRGVLVIVAVLNGDINLSQTRRRELLARSGEQFHRLCWGMVGLISRPIKYAPTRGFFLHSLLVVEADALDSLSDAESQESTSVLLHPSYGLGRQATCVGCVGGGVGVGIHGFSPFGFVVGLYWCRNIAGG